jgi:hypothetical protein
VIRPLRRRHLAAWIAIALLVPIGVSIALAARTAVPRSSVRIAAESSQAWKTQWARESFFAGQPLSIALQHVPGGEWGLRVTPTAPLVQPDLLMYWVHEDAVDLDSSARLIGAVTENGDGPLPIDAELLTGGGDLLLYSLAHASIVARAPWPGQELN